MEDPFLFDNETTAKVNLFGQLDGYLFIHDPMWQAIGVSSRRRGLREKTSANKSSGEEV